MSVSRRMLLKTLGAFATCAPVAGVLRASISGAAPPVAPLRLITVFHGLHAHDSLYHPRPVANATPAQVARPGSTFSLDFPEATLRPLSRWQSKVLVVRGLNSKGVPASHSTTLTAFTGVGASATYDNNACNDRCSVPATASSLEQYLHGRLAPAGAHDPIVVRAGYLGGQADFLSFRQGAVQTPQTNPAQLFDAYFHDLASMMGSPDAGTATSSRQQALVARRRAVAQHDAKALAALSARLAPPERAVLDQHLSSVNGVLARLTSAADAGTSTPPVECTAPGAANQAEAADAVQNLGNFIELIASAFACDLTRFASIQMFGQRGVFPVAQIPGWDTTKNAHDCSHDALGNVSNPDVLNLSRFQAFNYSQIARLMDALAARPDPLAPSQTLLDSTVILVVGEHGVTPCIWNNNRYEQGEQHGFDDLPVIVAGGFGGAVQMGRLLEATPRLGNLTRDAEGLVTNLNGSAVYAGVPHNALLTAVVNQFEANAARVTPAFTPQPLTQFGAYGPADGASPLTL